MHGLWQEVLPYLYLVHGITRGLSSPATILGLVVAILLWVDAPIARLPIVRILYACAKEKIDYIQFKQIHGFIAIISAVFIFIHNKLNSV